MRKRILMALLLTCVICFSMVFLGCTKREVMAEENTSAIKFAVYKENVETGKKERDDGFLSNVHVYMTASSKGVPQVDKYIYKGGKFTFWTHNIFSWSFEKWSNTQPKTISRVTVYKGGDKVHEYKGRMKDSGAHTVIYSQNLESGDYILQIEYSFTSPNMPERAVLEYRFSVDSTSPTVKVEKDGKPLGEGEHVNKEVSVSVNDANYYQSYVMHEGKVVEKTANRNYRYEFKKIGKYEFYAEDGVGNRSRKKIVYYDNEPPTLSVLENGEETEREHAKGSVSFVGSDNVGLRRIMYWTDSDPTEREYKNVPIVTKKDKETIYAVAEDLAGNKSTVRKVTLDTQSPTVTVTADGVLLKGEKTNAKRISIQISDNQGIRKVEIYRNGKAYTKDYAQIEENGVYEICAYDNAGNVSQKRKVIFDNIRPRLSVKTDTQPVDGLLHTNKKVIFDAWDEYDKASKIYIKKGDGEYKLSTQREIAQDGTYEVYAEDQCGNRSETISVRYNTKAPECNIHIDGSPSTAMYTNSSNIEVVSEPGAKIMQNYNGNWIEYASGYELQDGEHLFKAIDKAGNESAISKLIVDRVAPSIETPDIVSEPFAITFYQERIGKEIESVTINGKPYNGETIYPVYGGIYEVVAKDKAGNKCTKNIKSEYEGYINFNPKDECFDTPNLNGEIISFSTYEKAKEFATKREMSLVQEKPFSEELLTLYRAFNDDPAPRYGEPVYIYKGNKNGAEERIYFSKTALFTTLFQNIEDSIRKTMYFEKNAYKIGDREVRRKDKVFQKDEFTISSEYQMYLGVESVKKLVEEGLHEIEVEDKFGQRKQYKIHILKRVPEVRVKNEFDDLVLTKRSYFAKSIQFLVEKDSHLLLYNSDLKLIGCYSDADAPSLESDGTYYVQAVNRYGKGKMIEITISRDKPQAEFTSNESTQRLDVNILVPESVSITNIEIWREMHGINKKLATDDKGTVINGSNYQYSFSKSGIYRVYVKDAAHIEKTESVFEYKKPEPRIKASSNKRRVAKRFFVEFEGDVTASLIDGAKRTAYLSGTEITKEGKYTISLSNADGYKREIEFEIDNTPPVISGKFERKSNKDVVLSVSGASEVYVNNERIRHTNINCRGTGKYKVVAVDDVGNRAETSFEIDKDVDLSGVVNNGLYNEVTMKAGEELSLTLLKDNKQIPTAYNLKEPGEYEFVAKDNLGNVKKGTFRIVPKQMRSLKHNFHNGQFRLNGATSKGELSLTENGKYEIEYQGIKTTVEIINRTPQLKIDGLLKGGQKANKAILKAEKGSTVEILYKGKKIQYYEGMVCDKLGKYEVTVTDKYGNQKKTQFEIVKKKPIALVVTLTLLLAGIGVAATIFAVKKKKKNKNKKEKKK